MMRCNLTTSVRNSVLVKFSWAVTIQNLITTYPLRYLDLFYLTLDTKVTINGFYTRGSGGKQAFYSSHVLLVVCEQAMLNILSVGRYLGT